MSRGPKTLSACQHCWPENFYAYVIKLIYCLDRFKTVWIVSKLSGRFQKLSCKRLLRSFSQCREWCLRAFSYDMRCVFARVKSCYPENFRFLGIWSYLLVTLNKCLKGHKSLGLLLNVKNQKWHNNQWVISDQWVISEWSVISDKVPYWAVCGQL